MDNQVLTWLVGVIAFCMVFATVIVVLIGINAIKIMKRVDRLLLTSQNDLTLLSGQALKTLHEIKVESKILADQASIGISKAAIGTFVVGSIYRFLKKKNDSRSTQ
ncbi:MAG: hypothetical protein JXQ77_06295 [Campylobacterales bacterium]|nr:hypothetical protein [Campylobacterales bacterium]